MPNKKNIKSRAKNFVVVFDFDGVIIDSKELQMKALRICYQEYYGSGEPSYEDFFRLSGDSLFNIFTKMNLSTDLIDMYRSICSNSLGENKIISGMPELLLFLKEKMKYKCGLCTGKDRNRTIAILKYLRLKNYFDIIVCSDDVDNPKPHPESLHKIMEQLDIEPSKIIMVGDSKNDMLCAKNANIKCISVMWEQAPIIWADIEVTPDLQVSSVEELKNGILYFCSD